MTEIRFSPEAIADLQQPKTYIAKKLYTNPVRRAERQRNTANSVKESPSEKDGDFVWQECEVSKDYLIFNRHTDIV